MDFESLARDHGPALRSVALRLCRGPSDAQDLVQDTLERALRRFPNVPEHGNLRAWLITILRNRFIDYCRQRSRESGVQIDEMQVEAPVSQPEPKWAAITQEQVGEALAQLPEEFRKVYELHAIERKSYAEIALALGMPKATVGTRLLRARLRLREL